MIGHSFVINTYIAWPYFRLYYFPFVAIPTPLFYYGWVACPGRQKPFGTFMLCALAVLHCFWFYLMNRIAYKMMKGVSPQQVGEEEYEQSRSEDEKKKEN